MELKPGYKQTEVGVIPEDWEINNLENVCVPKGLVRGPFGGALKKEYFVRNGFKVFEQKNAIYGDFNLGDYFIDVQKFSELKRFELLPGDFIVSCSGTIGKIFLVPEIAPRGVINQALLKISTDDNKIIKQFFLHYFKWEKFQERIIDSTQGGAMKNLVGMSIFKETKIPLPPTKAEQTAIANALSDADALIQSITSLVAKKRQIKQGAMQTLLNPYENGRLKEGLVVKRLGRVAEFINGRAYSLSEWESHGTPVIRLQNLTGRGDEFYYSNLKLPEKQYCVAGDLLFMWSATFGPVIWKGEKAIYHYHIWKIEYKPEESDKTYLYFVLVDLTERLKRSSSSGGTMLHITKEKMESIEVHFPALEEQTRIATILSGIDAEIAALEAKLAKYRHIKQGMMQNLLTGRIRLVKPDSNTGAAA